MKSLIHYLSRRLGLLPILSSLVLLLTSSALKAQYIPIDSGFAELLIYNRMAHCVNNYQLDTLEAMNDSTLFMTLYGDSAHPLTLTTRNMNGLQYFTHASGYRSNGIGRKNLYMGQLSYAQTIATYLPNVFANLFIVDMPQLSSLPILGDSMGALHIERTNIASINKLPAALGTLFISSSPISSFPVIPNELQTFNIQNIPATAFPAFPPSIVEIDAMGVPISNISTLPPFLRTLNIGSNNNITSLPPLPSSLQYLVVTNNKLSILNSLPSGLVQLDITDNLITKLPPLPATIVDLRVSFNRLSCLPLLPDSLRYITTTGNNINCLPNYPPFLNLPIPILPICTDTDKTCIYAGVTGYLFLDRNGNCNFDNRSEKFGSPRIISFDQGAKYALTDTAGFYRIALDSGSHSLNPVLDTFSFKATCSATAQFNYNGRDTLNHIDYPLAINHLCTNMSVDIATARQINCRENSYTLSYTNKGSDTARNVTIDVLFPKPITILSSTPLWSSTLAGNIYRYSVGTVPPLEGATIYIIDSVACGSVQGSALCVKARVAPINSCLQASTLWDSSQVSVSSSYVPGADTVYFTIRNTGQGMANATQYRVYEDELIQIRKPLQLAAGDSLVLALWANGHTYHVEADQSPYHPGKSRPREFRELAGPAPFILGKVASIPQDDLDEWVEIDCHVVRGSYDPNEKEVYPSGIGANHYVTKDDDLKYIIGFQNTGNDTAYKVVLIDTLDTQHLDISSFEAGASSHEYSVTMIGNGIVKWTFNPIRLVDSMTNEPASHGWVKFKIKQKAGNIPGTRINNAANIYFDSNPAIRTATSFVTIELPSVIFPLSITEPTAVRGYSISTYPNPFEERVKFVIINEKLTNDSYQLEVIDMLGTRVLSRTVSTTFELERSSLSTGLYLYRITRAGVEIGTGKVLAR